MVTAQVIRLARESGVALPEMPWRSLAGMRSDLIEEACAMTKKPAPPYPYDQRTDTITLPPDIEKQVRQMVLSGNRIEAMRRVMDLTGAGLKVSKDYIDGLAGSK
jgi:hypothetical protein